MGGGCVLSHRWSGAWRAAPTMIWTVAEIPGTAGCGSCSSNMRHFGSNTESATVTGDERVGSRWLTLLAVFCTLAFQACPQHTEVSDSLAPEISGCFEHPDGHAQGWVALSPEEGNLLSCDGAGLVDLGLGADEVWTCIGQVVDSMRRDDGGFEASGWLRISAQDDGPQVVVAQFTYQVSGAGEETLVLQRGGRPDVVLVRCP